MSCISNYLIHKIIIGIIIQQNILANLADNDTLINTTIVTNISTEVLDEWFNLDILTNPVIDAKYTTNGTTIVVSTIEVKVTNADIDITTEDYNLLFSYFEEEIPVGTNPIITGEDFGDSDNSEFKNEYENIATSGFTENDDFQFANLDENDEIQASSLNSNINEITVEADRGVNLNNKVDWQHAGVEEYIRNVDTLQTPDIFINSALITERSVSIENSDIKTNEHQQVSSITESSTGNGGEMITEKELQKSVINKLKLFCSTQNANTENTEKKISTTDVANQQLPFNNFNEIVEEIQTSAINEQHSQETTNLNCFETTKVELETSTLNLMGVGGSPNCANNFVSNRIDAKYLTTKNENIETTEAKTTTALETSTLVSIGTIGIISLNNLEQFVAKAEGRGNANREFKIHTLGEAEQSSNIDLKNETENLGNINKEFEPPNINELELLTETENLLSTESNQTEVTVQIISTSNKDTSQSTNERVEISRKGIEEQWLPNDAEMFLTPSMLPRTTNNLESSTEESTIISTNFDKNESLSTTSKSQQLSTRIKYSGNRSDEMEIFTENSMDNTTESNMYNTSEISGTENQFTLNSSAELVDLISNNLTILEEEITTTEITSTTQIVIKQDTLKDIAYYLRAHKFNEYDRRYETKPEFAPRRFFMEFPRPPLRSLHWEVRRFCEPSFYECVEYLRKRLRYTASKRVDDTVVVMREQKWNIVNNSQQIKLINEECKKLRRIDDVVADPFEGPLERFQWRSTASYYMCWYTMQQTRELEHLSESCDNFANCLDINLGPNNMDQRADDGQPFACALYSFCPDPCCAEKHLVRPEYCLDSPDNPCFESNFAGQRECTVNRSLNVEFRDMVLNRWNVTCRCPNAGLEWNSLYGMCVDIDECTTGTHNCDKKLEACVNLQGSFRCACKWGHIWNEKKKKCVSSAALGLIKLRRKSEGGAGNKTDSFLKKFLRFFKKSSGSRMLQPNKFVFAFAAGCIVVCLIK